MQRDEVSNSMLSGLFTSSSTARDWSRQRVWSRIRISRTWTALTFISSEEWWCFPQTHMSPSFCFSFFERWRKGFGQNAWWNWHFFLDHMTVRKFVVYDLVLVTVKNIFLPISLLRSSSACTVQSVSDLSVPSKAVDTPATQSSCCCDHLCKIPQPGTGSIFCVPAPKNRCRTCFSLFVDHLMILSL